MTRELQGNCKTILEETDLFADATERAQAIESSRKIGPKEFSILCEGKTRKGYKYGLNETLGVVWSYGPKNDTHYFYT